MRNKNNYKSQISNGKWKIVFSAPAPADYRLLLPPAPAPQPDCGSLVSNRTSH
jgi:hypothetical protein